MKRIEIRISETEKQAAEAKAQELGITLTQLIKDSLSENSLRDYTFEKKYLAVILKITSEFNQIGKNINHILKKINLIQMEYKLPEDEIAELNKLFREYLQTREKLSYQIERISSCQK